MENLLYVINLDGQKIAFTNGREYIRFVNGNFAKRPIAKATIVGLFDEDARTVNTGKMDKKLAYFLNYGKHQTIAFDSELARAIHAREIGASRSDFFEAVCYHWASDVNSVIDNQENEGC